MLKFGDLNSVKIVAILFLINSNLLLIRKLAITVLFMTFTYFCDSQIPQLKNFRIYSGEAVSRRSHSPLRRKPNPRRDRNTHTIHSPGWRCFAPDPGLPSPADLRPAYIGSVQIYGNISPLAAVSGECRHGEAEEE